MVVDAAKDEGHSSLPGHQPLPEEVLMTSPHFARIRGELLRAAQLTACNTTVKLSVKMGSRTGIVALAVVQS
jgi:hypothetical protein